MVQTRPSHPSQSSRLRPPRHRRLQLKLGDYSAARAAFQRVVDLEGENPDALLGLALAELDAASPVPPSSSTPTTTTPTPTSGHRLGTARGCRGCVRRVRRPRPEASRARVQRRPANAATTAAPLGIISSPATADRWRRSRRVWCRHGRRRHPRLRAEAAFARGRVHHDKGDLARAQALYATASQLDDPSRRPRWVSRRCARARRPQVRHDVRRARVRRIPQQRPRDAHLRPPSTRRGCRCVALRRGGLVSRAAAAPALVATPRPPRCSKSGGRGPG